MIKMCNFGSFHGLTRNVETVIYVFIASDRSRNCAACMKDRSLWWKIALCDNSYSVQSLLLCYSRLQRFISRNCWLLYKSSPSGSSWKYQRNCGMKCVELERISADFLSSLWLDNRFLENSSRELGALLQPKFYFFLIKILCHYLIKKMLFNK